MVKQFQRFSRPQGHEDQSKTTRLRIMLQIFSRHSTNSRSQGKILASSSKFPTNNLETMFYF